MMDRNLYRTDNQILAIFMGAELHEYNIGMSDNKMYHFKSSYPFDRRIIKDKERVICTADMLWYHDEWNWLMQVMEKIESLGYTITVFGRPNAENRQVVTINKKAEFILKVQDEDKMTAIYKAVVEFVKWYNTIKK